MDTLTTTMDAELMQHAPLTLLQENVTSLTNEQFALIRRQGLGASDASVYLGLMAKFNKSETTLIKEKRKTEVTKEELAIGAKENVRKGRDLEPLNLTKFGELTNTDVSKPMNMYRCKDFPYLTINFDGVIKENGHFIPVEAKYVSIYGEKYYNRNVAYFREFGDCNPYKGGEQIFSTDMVARCGAKAALHGIPDYYYAQVQQQMLGLDSPYGYLSALHDKGWELCVYRIPRDEEVISALKVEGYRIFNKIQKREQA